MKKAVQKPLKKKKEVNINQRYPRIRRQHIETIDPQEEEGSTETTQDEEGSTQKPENPKNKKTVHT
jgi:hypothetical protein